MWSPDIRADAVRVKATVPIARVIGETLPLRRNGHTMTALCPFHNEGTPSFTVYSDHFHCFGCGRHGDVFDWLTETHRMTFAEAVAYLAGGPSSISWHSGKHHLDGSMPARPRPTPPQPQATGVAAEAFLHCWNQGNDPVGTIVETYLWSRGRLTLPQGAPIRFHPRCQRGPSNLPGGPEYWPAMLALMTDPVSAQPVGLHRTYLRPDGTSKAPVTVRGDRTLKPKMVLGTWGVIRLTPDDDISRALAIAEGIENALTAAQTIGWGPVWAAGTRGCIAKFPLLNGIEALSIFADADDGGVGLSAARVCAQRWEQAGQECLIHVPPAGLDWNDAAQRIAA